MKGQIDKESSFWTKVKALSTSIYHIWIGERPGPLAASLAYYALFSVVPITYLAITIAGIFVDTSQTIGRLSEEIGELLGPEAVEQLTAAVNTLAESTTKGSTIGTVISFIVLLFSASLIFFQLQYVLNNVWQAPPPTRGETTNYIRNRLLAFVMVFSVGLILVLAAVANIIVSLISILPSFEGLLSLANILVFGLLLMFSLAMIYKFLPNVEIAWRDVWVGSAVTAALIIAAIELFGFLLSANRFSTALQAAGSVALFLISFYFLATIFVFGAVFTRVYATLFGSHIESKEGSARPDVS
jgi:membrane protein